MNSKILINLFAITFIFIACNREPEKLPTGENKLLPDIVENPASASGSVDSSKIPKFYFSKDTHHFGEITEGEKVSYTFKFSNTGGAPLVITQASGSCGCTVPEFSKDPVPPGGEGQLKVTFDSNGKPGMQSKTITVLANTIPATKILTISAEVLQPEKK